MVVAQDPARASRAALLLHGLSGSPLEMQYLARRLRASGFFVQSPAIPGCGFGTRADPFDSGSWREWVAFTAGQLDLLTQQYDSVHVAGLCIGAVIGLRLAIERPHQVASLSLISTTLAYDGWAMPWYRFLIPVGYYTPLRRRYAFPERHPYGLKNERLREWVKRAMEAHGHSAAGAAALPLTGIHEALQMIRAVRRDIARATAPALVMHAVEDDVASVRSAEFVALRSSASEVRTILFENSYHALTLDNDKESVADETIAFFHRHCGDAAESTAAAASLPANATPARRGLSLAR